MTDKASKVSHANVQILQNLKLQVMRFVVPNVCFLSPDFLSQLGKKKKILQKQVLGRGTV
jgi:hypothetical protein